MWKYLLLGVVYGSILYTTFIVGHKVGYDEAVKEIREFVDEIVTSPVKNND